MGVQTLVKTQTVHEPYIRTKGRGRVCRTNHKAASRRNKMKNKSMKKACATINTTGRKVKWNAEHYKAVD